MLLAVCALLHCCDSAPTYSGRDHELDVPIPRFDVDVTRAAASHSNLFHADVLLSYQPIPGTVVFAGYGSDMVDEEAFQFRGLRRTDDAFFLKLSYLFRL